MTPIPLSIMPSELIITYLFISVLSFIYILLLSHFSNQLQTYKDHSDQMRSDLHRLQARLQFKLAIHKKQP